MIDIHSHLIPAVDDGSRSIEETVEMLKEAKNAGFTDIILTPHYMESAYRTEVAIIDFWREQLQKIVESEQIGVKLYSGNEVYISAEMDRLFKENEFKTLNDSKYLLMELPLNSTVKYLNSIIFKLKAMNITPIIAHPERYSCVHNDLEFVQFLVDQGCLIQCNFGSIIGMYGTEPEKIIKQLLQRNLVHFLGSDCHRPNTIYAAMGEIINRLKEITTEEQFQRITEENAKKLINQKQI